MTHTHQNRSFDGTRSFAAICYQDTVYQISVGNLGTVCTSASWAEAYQSYKAYCDLSRENVGRAAGESVTAFELCGEHVDIVSEYLPETTETEEN